MWMVTRNKGRKGVVGVELRGDALACAHVKRDVGQPAVSAFEYRALEAGGEASALSAFVQRHGLKGADCVGVIPQGDYQLLQVEPPEVPASERRQAIKWRLRERIDFPVAEAVVDVFDPPQGARRSADNLNAVVCRAGVVARCVETIRAAGLQLQALDIVELVQRNVLAALTEPGSATALLSFQEGAGLITLVKDAELYLARDLDYGLAGMREAAAAGDANAPIYESIVLELQRSLDYFESSFGMAAINRLLVYPQGDGVDQLLSYIEGTLPSLQTAILDPGQVFDRGTAVPPGCLNAFGAALRQPEAAA